MPDDIVLIGPIGAGNQYASDQIVYIDQASVDDTHDYPYGDCPQGARFDALKLGHRTERISLVAGGV
jgi:hypothetical protein